MAGVLRQLELGKISTKVLPTGDEIDAVGDPSNFLDTKILVSFYNNNSAKSKW